MALYVNYRVLFDVAISGEIRLSGTTTSGSRTRTCHEKTSHQVYRLHLYTVVQWRIQNLQTGGQGRAPQARVSRRRRRRGGEVWGGGFPYPLGEESGEGTLPPPQKIFLTLDLKMSTSSAFWALFFAVQLYFTSKKHCFWAYKTCCCSLHAMHSTETAKGGKHKPVGK